MIGRKIENLLVGGAKEGIQVMKPCAWCGKPIKEDYRLGKYEGVWFCSEACEREFVEYRERADEPRKK